jgi:alpha-beta hydrolase superfamily lysophospholipase
MSESTNKSAGKAHWAPKGAKRLFLWEKPSTAQGAPRGAILFVHGSSEASTPVFDLQVPGRANSSAMDWFASQGFDTWCVDLEGYGRSTKDRSHNSDIATGAADLEAAARHIRSLRGEVSLLVYGISSGALRAALFAQNHPNLVQRLALDAFVYTGEGSPTLAERRKRLPQFLASNTRTLDRASVRAIFERDHPGAADMQVVDAYADEVLALDSDLPTGTYLDMCSKLPIVEPERVTVPTIIMRGQYDGIASPDDLYAFFTRLPNPDKQLAVMPGIAHSSFQEKNYLLAYHILLGFFTRPAPVYTGG